MDSETTSWGGDNGLWIFALLLLFGMGGFGGFNQTSRSATVEDLNTTTNFSRLEQQVANNGDTTERKTDGIINGLSSLGYEMASQFGATNSAVATGFCNTSKEILESRYLNEKAIADSNASITAQIAALRNDMAQDKIASLQAQVNNLNMQNMINQATAGTVKYPSALTYNAGTSPFCSGCNGGI